MRLTLLALLLAASAARADGLDRDTLLTDAPAVPDKGTVRITGGATGNTDSGGVETGSKSQSNVTGSIGWSPVQNVHADVGAYYQTGRGGPQARVRYQFLSQKDVGVDLSGGVRFKTVGYHRDNSEVEFLVAAGRKFGKFEVVLNGVFGVEASGGKDIEAKGFAGYRFNEAVRAGIDSRLQTEAVDAEKPTGAVATVRDYDLTVGPAVSWLIARTFQLQALVGMAQPKKTNITSPVGVLQASIDF